ADKTDDFVRFTPTADLCGAGAGRYDYTVSDGSLTDSGRVTVDITCVNDAPVNTVPGAQTTAEDTSKVFSTAHANALSVADLDVAETAGGTLRVTLSVDHGTLSLAGTAGLSFTVGDGTTDATMT